ncbi:aminotransferase class V-fold PLP-dependent enzyme [Pseudomonas fluorescens]|uniref:Putative aminotransferase n=1 Tax=Pseudomonas fluorescens (strain Pf0-1) TaxID=205922 RepID=Q3KGV6_PSEPF|nr:aminotransferase class V-fold PLP-dependent enzyme [Pseudomonas fluorescens]ABA73000.1 putative aminotransferase [Pseudomonas fluorescens Pf0-1]MBY9022793.1 aminotransferase class V-fold PLP-dependent enzyme [Pseudomonas fluorescens]MBY9028785.1 aminotransferase class V-fold PLP-dependent enzyme [Pseudomonas fluorescens]MBY9034997.1 aminotransferase class V-fold PLP-dependent enzyme [Pseudomonas fluorescens]MBY9040436.1 aminotransferase class V-fold PLP-dependent enzyme [Pseudomonas fluores
MNIDDLSRLRAATPGCAQVVHFNHAGASLPSQATLDAVIEQLQREALGGPMEAADNRVQARARNAAAALLNAQPEDIAFASSGSAAWSQAFNALGPWQPGERILVGRHEWAGNLACMAEAVKAGARLEVIPCDAHGAVDPQALAQMIDSQVRLIALTWLPANGGLINPAAQIGNVARRHGIPYFIDAGQALGQLPCDVQDLQCDVLKGAGRKFLRGPRGTALMYIRAQFLQRLLPVQRDVLSAPWDGKRFTLRDDARRFETSEVSLALLAGLANALEEHNRLGAFAIRQRIAHLSNGLRQRLKAIPGLTLRNLGAANQQSGLIAFTLEGWDSVALKQTLAERRINIGANGVAYTPLDMQARGLTNIARVALSYLNTEEEIDVLLENLTELAARPQISISTQSP